jgi:hypothetical protein
MSISINIVKEKTMKKLLILLIGLTTLVNCKTIDKTTVGGKETIVVNHGMFGMKNLALFNSVFSSDMEDCLKDLQAEGVTEVTSLNGTSKDSADRKLFSVPLSTSYAEGCQAVGHK